MRSRTRKMTGCPARSAIVLRGNRVLRIRASTVATVLVFFDRTCLVSGFGHWSFVKQSVRPHARPFGIGRRESLDEDSAGFLNLIAPPPKVNVVVNLNEITRGGSRCVRINSRRL